MDRGICRFLSKHLYDENYIGGISLSIRTKLSIAISLIVTFILVLNIVFAQINATRAQESNVQQQVTNIARQLSVTIKLIDTTNRSIEKVIATRLKAAAQAAELRLDPHIENITTEQLLALKEELDLDDITLWVRDENNELVTTLSSNPDEIGLRSKTWDYWNVALNDVFSLRPVTVAQGERSTNFYAGPINFAVSDPSEVNKWGYYYSGKTNYMINTVLNTDRSFPNGYIGGAENTIQQLLAENEALLEITAFNPKFFGKEKIIKMKQGQPVYNLDVRDITFGSYNYMNVETDIENVRRVLDKNTVITSNFTFDNLELSRTYIPIEESEPYVIGVVMDKGKLLSDTRKQLQDHIVIAIILLLITIAGSYLIAVLMTSPLTKIMNKVNAIAMNNFHTPLTHKSSDELGQLAVQVNTMGNNLLHYTNELRQTNTELMSTKQYLQSIIAHTGDAIHIVDLNLYITEVNAAFVNMFEWSSEELIGKPLENFATEDQKSYEQLLHRVILGETVTNFETTMYAQSNQPIYVSMSMSGILNEQGHIVAIASITRNISARKQNEVLIVKNEKLSAMGQLAASIAHEIRNPLTTIRGFLKLNYQNGNLPEHHMQLVMSEVDHMNDIVGQFLVLSKPGIGPIQQIDVTKLIEDIVMLMHTSGRLEDIKVVTNFNEQLPMINGVENNLKQLLVNLIKNAIEAMPDGGQLTVNVSSSSDCVGIEISDTGVGLSEQALARLGEPFYTSKKDGNGLGLLVSHQIVTNHKGLLTFTSVEGESTTAIIQLPIK